jgi:hypothetical protein
LVETVRVVVRRHVTAADLAEHAAVVQRSVLARAPRFVQRYSIAEERWDDLVVVVRVEADVDRDRILTSLVSAGVPVATLPVKPRLLVVPLDSAAGAPVRAMARALEAAGYHPQVVPSISAFVTPSSDVSPGSIDEIAVASWARDAGCHLAVAVETSGGAMDRAGSVPDSTGNSSGVVIPQIGFWSDPGGALRRSELPAEAWLVDPTDRLPLRKVEAIGSGVGSDRETAEADAAARVGLELGYRALQVLEQSGWEPGGEPALLQVGVSGLVDPLLVEEIASALALVPEVNRVRLEEVSQRRAQWALEVVDSGLDWAAVLGTARLPRGRLEWFQPAAGAAVQTHVPEATLRADARWRGP